ncbi:hypothetical protein BX666DRAFT_875324 [Dichotomocladium elegans]|nr:hypothetical protein BX666DRAFT_875324 [Dichotomocladium elegans]
MNCMATCRAWYEAIPFFATFALREVYFQSNRFTEGMRLIRCVGPHIRHFDSCYIVNFTSLMALLRPFKDSLITLKLCQHPRQVYLHQLLGDAIQNVTHLTVDIDMDAIQVDCPPPSPWIDLDSNRLQCLKWMDSRMTLSRFHDHALRFLVHCRHLRCISFNRAPSITKRILPMILEKCPTIERIEIDNYSYTNCIVAGEGWRDSPFSAPPPRLRSLSFQCLSADANGEYLSCLRQCKALESVSLTTVLAAELVAITTATHQLKDVVLIISDDLSMPQSITSRDIARFLAAQQSTIQRLDLRLNRLPMTADIFEAIARAKMLETLTLHVQGANDMVDGQYIAGLSSLHQIRHLTLITRRMISRAAWEGIGWGMPHLETFTLCGSADIDWEAVLQVIEYRANAATDTYSNPTFTIDLTQSLTTCSRDYEHRLKRALEQKPQAVALVVNCF